MKQILTDFMSIVFGNYATGEYLGAVFLTFVGYALWFLYNYINSDKPRGWNWKIFHDDKNIPYMIFLFISAMAFLRFNEDSLVGIDKATGSKLGFIKDVWFWFLIGGAMFRLIIHRVHKLYKKYKSK